MFKISCIHNVLLLLTLTVTLALINVSHFSPSQFTRQYVNSSYIVDNYKIILLGNEHKANDLKIKSPILFTRKL